MKFDLQNIFLFETVDFRGREGGKFISWLLVHAPNAFWKLVGLNLRAQNAVQVSHIGGKDSVQEPSIVRLNRKQELDNDLSHSDTG